MFVWLCVRRLLIDFSPFIQMNYGSSVGLESSLDVVRSLGKFFRSVGLVLVLVGSAAAAAMAPAVITDA